VNQPFSPRHSHKDPPGWKKSRILACHLEAFRSSYCKSNKNARIVESSGIWHLFSDWRYSRAFSSQVRGVEKMAGLGRLYCPLVAQGMHKTLQIQMCAVTFDCLKQLFNMKTLNRYYVFCKKYMNFLRFFHFSPFYLYNKMFNIFSNVFLRYENHCD
jgi:hypothetical protein